MKKKSRGIVQPYAQHQKLLRYVARLEDMDPQGCEQSAIAK